jgi:hypothetical protein
MVLSITKSLDGWSDPAVVIPGFMPGIHLSARSGARG